MRQAGGADMKKTFLKSEKPIFTVMTQAKDPQRIKELIDKSTPLGAEAFGMQFERLKPEYKNRKVYKELFSYSEKPVYATNYRGDENEGKSDETLAEELLELSKCGAALCDVIGDLFDKQPDEFATDKNAIYKQEMLIEKLHKNGSEVLISSHILKFTPAEKVLEIALEHQRRGADISKIVTGAETMEEQLENLKIVNMLKNELKIPFLFLSGGKCEILRRIGGELGSCMYLCVYEQDEFSTREQPFLRELKAIRKIKENIGVMQNEK